MTRNGLDADVDRTGVPDRRYVRTPATAPGPSGPQMLTAFGAIRRDPLQFLAAMQTRYGDVVQFPIPQPPTYLVADAEAARHVLAGNARNYGKRTLQYSALSLVTGEGLLVADTPAWRRQRPLVQPAFHRDSIDRIGEHVAVAVDRLLAEWGALPARGAVVDVDEAMMRVTLEIVGASLFGTDLSGDADRLARATLRALDVVVARARVPVTPPSWVPTPANRRLSSAVRELDDAVASMIARRDGSGGSADMLDLLLTAHDGDDALSAREVRDQVITFVVAGHETVASALSWAWWLLARDRAAQERLQAEADEVLGGRLPTTADAVRLPYARAVFDEAMRLYPPAWLVTRRSLGPDVLAGREVPGDALIILSPYLVHRDPRVWERPGQFDPERFLGARARGGAASAGFWPFGAGPRLCIGREFAYLEAVLLLAAIAGRVRVSEQPGIPEPHAEPLVTIRPVGLHGGLPLRVTPR